MLELLRDYLTRIEKLHLGLPHDLVAEEPVSREATEKELLRILVHSSMSFCPPGEGSPSQSPRRSMSPGGVPRHGSPPKSDPRSPTTGAVIASPSAASSASFPRQPMRTIHYTRPLYVSGRQDSAPTLRPFPDAVTPSDPPSVAFSQAKSLPILQPS
eukprot:TRINITY_DN45880_c0_g1_i1.p1 TRINITY_DN45880_c0_g1~~TRINITY_DN45880_c0_g1_i1.p1  ORF type:complete len:157 (-),score=23.50 TRINITY_DN45880_c0_g1_i1:68-538(-)